MEKRDNGSEPEPGAERYLPRPNAKLAAHARAAQGCRGCDLYGPATQAVFGDGAAGARMMLIGEQPGDVEDRTGKPFTGPAGRELDRAFELAGIEREAVFLTNAVKHFRFKDRGRIFDAEPLIVPVMVTLHPSAILRAPDGAARQELRDLLAADLAAAGQAVEGRTGSL